MAATIIKLTLTRTDHDVEDEYCMCCCMHFNLQFTNSDQNLSTNC